MEAPVREAAPILLVLPEHSELSPPQLAFLDEHFRTREDLLVRAPHLVAALKKRSSDLDTDLRGLGRNFAKRVVSWISRSFAARTSIRNLNLKLENLCLRTSPSWFLLLCHSTIWFNSTTVELLCYFILYYINLLDGIGLKMFGEELPQLAKQVRQIEDIRYYVGELWNIT